MAVVRVRQRSQRRPEAAGREARDADLVVTLGQLLDAAPVAVAATTGPDHEVLYANPALCRFVGLERLVLVRKPLAASLPPARQTQATALLDRVYATGRAEGTTDLGLSGVEGVSSPWPAFTSPIVGEDQHPTGLLVQLSAATRSGLAPDSEAPVAVDVQDANRRLLVAGLEAQRHSDDESAINAELRAATDDLRASERRYLGRAAELQAMIDAIEDGVAVLDGARNVSVTNDALARILGLTVATEGGLRRALQDVELDPNGQPTAPPLQRNGRWLEVRTFAAANIHPDVAASRVVMIRDVTDERAARETREAFIGVLSHELRTPVTTIVGMARLLGRSSIDADAGTRSGLVGDIVAESERLERLVEDLLVLSRAERDQLIIEPEPVLLQHVIREAVAREAIRFPLVSFFADTARLPPVSADRTFVTQVVRNMLSNAGKYGPDGACEVRVTADRDGDDVVVQVLDQGAGFPAADRDRLFDLFFRSSGSARLKPGAGIGLYVTRMLIEAMGGRVWATARDGGGSAFGFSLPIVAGAYEREVGSPETSQ